MTDFRYSNPMAGKRQIMRSQWQRVFGLILVLSCGSTTAPGIDVRPGAENLLVLRNARIITMHDAQVLQRHGIVMRGDTITQVAPMDRLSVPAGATVIDVGNRYVLPGLIDMHVHIRRNDLPAYLASGVTSVRNLWGYVELAATRSEIEAGTLSGPRIHSLSSGFDGPPAEWPQTQLIDDVRRIPELMDAQVRQGYDEIKVYTRLSREAYDSIVALARRRGLTFSGHVPNAVPVQHALSSGQRSIEHLSGYDAAAGTVAGRVGFGHWASIDPVRLAPLAEQTRQAGTWNCPTLAIIEILARGSASASQINANRKRMVKALHDAGAPLLVGTDSGIDQTQPGTSIVDELRLMVEAGLTPYQALLGATRDAAEYLRRQSEVGTIRQGGRADLLVLDRNPLDDISAVAAVAGVVARGRWLVN